MNVLKYMAVMIPTILMLVKFYLGGNVWYYGGKVEKIRDVLHYDFTDFRWSAEQSRNFIAERGWQTVVGIPNQKSNASQSLRINQICNANGW